MKFLAAMIISICVLVNAAASCVQTLDDADHKWVTAKVSDVGFITPGSNKRQLKLTFQNWVITALPPDSGKLSKGDSVAIRQDGDTLSVRTKTDTINLRLVCIQKVAFVE